MSEYEDAFLLCQACHRNVVRRYAHLSDIKPRPNGNTLCDGCWKLMQFMQNQVDAHNGRVILEDNGITGLTNDDFNTEMMTEGGER